jgi:hypothetical protein
MRMNAHTRRSPCTGSMDKGYVVYVEDFKNDLKTVYPIDPSDKGYTAEEVAKQWVPLRQHVGDHTGT